MTTARQDIQLGVEPKGLGGHNNRQAHVICNAQFTELYKAMGAVFGGVNSGEDGAKLPSALPISKGGTGGTTDEEARDNLSVYSKSEVDSLYKETITVAKGGTGGTTDEEARDNLSVYSKSEVDNKFSPASVTQAGIVQLVDDLTSGGTDKALTAEQGMIIDRILENLSDSAETKNNVINATTPKLFLLPLNTLHFNTRDHDYTLTVGFRLPQNGNVNIEVNGVIAGYATNYGSSLDNFISLSARVPRYGSYKMNAIDGAPEITFMGWNA